jgi:hypothetical protein
MSIDIGGIITILSSPEIAAKFFWYKIGFLSVSALLLAAIIFLILNTHYLQWLYFQDIWAFFTFRPFGAKRIVKNWNKILKRLDSGLESEYKLAIVEADDLMDFSLRRMGYEGKTFEEKLSKLTSATLPNIAKVIEVHKLRNELVHNPDYQLSLDEARNTMDVYQKAFNALQLLS